jgi:hypothetical protein
MLGVRGGREAEKVEDLLLLGGEFGFEGLDEDAVVVQLVAGEVGEGLQDPLRAGAVQPRNSG